MRPRTGREPLVSVVIKSYNHAAYIGRTIESVLAQTLQDFEIVVTDDASTDDTAEVVRGFTDPRISLHVLEENQGLSGAMNATLARARGRYVAILNSDDYALPDRLAQQVTALGVRPATGAVFTAVRMVDETGREKPGETAFDAPLAFTDYRRATWLRAFFFHGNCLCAPSATIRREVFADVGLYDRRLTNLQDLDLWVRLAAKWDIDFLPERLTAFRVRDRLRNLSAPRRDTIVRSQFETFGILQHFLDLDRATVREMLGPERSSFGPGEREKKRALAEAALETTSAPHRLFGARTLYDLAKTTADYKELATLTGAIDFFDAGLTLRAKVDRFCIVADGVAIEPVVFEDRQCFDIPVGARDVYLASPMRAAGGKDLRRLGVAISSLVVRDVTGEVTLDLHDPAFRDGFHGIETSERGSWRWTNGYARLPDEVLHDRCGPIRVEVTGMLGD